MLSIILLAGLGLASHATAACSRTLLKDIVTSYITAQTTGNLSSLPLGTTVTYIENDILTDLTKGVLAKGTSIDFHRSVYDEVDCATYTELNTATSSHPYVIHTRIGLGADNKIAIIDSVVSDDGDWIFDAKLHLNFTKAEKWDPIPKEKWDARDVIKAAGDAYLNQWGSVNLTVPLGTPCTRLEGGLYTGSRDPAANTCRMPAFPQPLKVAKRRYVIDQELGTVGILNDFPWLEATLTNGSTPSSNMFRVEGGLIRYIHEVTVCATRQCGR
ncbi:hypothetical protein OQA88_703 [Cercophora sp. LCS_1]